MDEIWCVAVNDCFVMNAWRHDQKAEGSVRFLSDGNGDLATAMGLTLDLRARGFGLRSKRFSMLLVDGVVRHLNVEEPGKFEVSGAATILGQITATL